MEMTNDLLDLMNTICKIAFMSYAWITMLRVNAYIAKQEREDKLEEKNNDKT